MKKRLLTILSLSISFASSGQTVTTITDTIHASGGISLGPDNRIYVADYGASLNLADGSDVYTVDAINGASLLTTGLNGGKGNDFGPDGMLYQANASANSIVRISPEGGLEIYVDDGVFDPSGVYVALNGDVFVASCSGSILKIEDDGEQVSSFAFSPLFVCPKGIVGDGAGNLYVTNFSTSDVLKVDDNGNVTLFATLPGTNNGHIKYCPVAEALYTTSHSEHQIYKVDLEGNYEVIAGTGERGNEDGLSELATFSRPNGIAVSITGDTLYVNSSIPTTDDGFPLNPSVIRMITGLNPNTAIGSAPSNKKSAIRVFPNPSSDTFQVELNAVLSPTASLRMINCNMEEVLRRNASRRMLINETSDLPHGLYYLILEDNGFQYTTKVILQ